MKKNFSKVSIVSVALFAPAVAFAQEGLINLLGKVQNLIQMVIPILIGLALLAFLWGILNYLFSKNKDEAKTFMIWGIIALFVMTSVWGLVSILRNTILPNNNIDSPTNIPQAPGFGTRLNNNN